jgi:hypothetical protein
MQKFQKGDWVRIAKNLGDSMRHFESGCEAIVIGSYADQYGGSNHNSYTLYLKGRGQCSWYYGSQLTLIEPGRLDKLQAWQEEAEAEKRQKSDLDWIFANGPSVSDNPNSASIEALAECFGLMDMCGCNGEGLNHYRLSMSLLTVRRDTSPNSRWYVMTFASRPALYPLRAAYASLAAKVRCCSTTIRLFSLMCR